MFCSHFFYETFQQHNIQAYSNAQRKKAKFFIEQIVYQWSTDEKSPTKPIFKSHKTSFLYSVTKKKEKIWSGYIISMKDKENQVYAVLLTDQKHIKGLEGFLHIQKSIYLVKKRIRVTIKIYIMSTVHFTDL